MVKLTCWTKEDKDGDKYTTCLQGQKGYKPPKKKKLVIKEKKVEPPKKKKLVIKEKPVEVPKKKKLVIKEKPVEVPKKKKLVIKEKPKPVEVPKRKKLVIKEKKVAPPTITITENPRDNVIPVSRGLSYTPDSLKTTTKRINIGKDAPKAEQPAPKKKKLVIKEKKVEPVEDKAEPVEDDSKIKILLDKYPNEATIIGDIWRKSMYRRNPSGFKKMTSAELYEKHLDILNNEDLLLSARATFGKKKGKMTSNDTEKIIKKYKDQVFNYLSTKDALAQAQAKQQ